LSFFIIAVEAKAKDTDSKENIEISFKGRENYAVVVEKRIQKLTVLLINEDLQTVKEFPCATGRNKGDKHKEGDGKTPSGIYFVIGEFLDKDLAPIYGSRAFPLDYPNGLDQKNKKNGSAIWLHGTNKKLTANQTNGCVALKNQDIDTLKSYIQFNRTPIIIVEELGEITILKDFPTNSSLNKILSERQQSLLSGSYHDLLSLYHPDYLPPIAWWSKWQRQRESIVLSQKIKLEQRDLFYISSPNQSLVLFDQFLSGKTKKIQMGTTKLFFADYDGNRRILSEEIRLSDGEWKLPIENPVIAAGKHLLTPVTKLEEANILVNNWLKAWSKKDIKKYASYYSSEFKSQKGLSLNQWVTYKKRLNSKYKYITVTKQNLTIREKDDRLYVSFIQKYKNNQFKSSARKTLILKTENGDWKIIRELV